MDRDTKLKIYGLAAMAAISFFINVILDSDFNWEPWLKILAVMSMFFFGIMGFALASAGHRYLGIAICISVAVAFFYYESQYGGGYVEPPAYDRT